jgi:acetoacetyl-CoA synthetase
MSSKGPPAKTLWSPGNASITTQLSNFAQLTPAKSDPINMSKIYDWSVEEPEKFWSTLLNYLKIVHSGDTNIVLERGSPFYLSKWFPDVKLNFAENLLSKRSDDEALIEWNEYGSGRRVTFSKLYQEVARVSALLQGLGVQCGDRVAALLPNTSEAVIAMLATTSLGAVWTSSSPDFGVDGIVERFGQVSPKILFVADGYVFKGTEIDLRLKNDALRKALSTVTATICVPRLELPLPSDLISFQEGRYSWPLTFTQVPFDHPLCILYSSGTTGKPKCIVHRTGGVLLEHLKELRLHTDLNQNDTFFYQTTCGWMMWNWLISGLAVGSRLLLFDGSPMAKDGRVLWEMAEGEEITVFGTNAKYLSLVEKNGVVPRQEFSLPKLRTILSTGSPLLPENFDYVYDQISSSVQLSSISGGTDILGCFALGSPVNPVRRGELQCRSLGLDVRVYNDIGESVTNEPGELVCRAPFPSMPLSFWNDPGYEKYHAAYFGKFPNVWAHGDFAQLNDTGGLILYGRSDAVLNPGGVRIGTAEIYRQVESFAEVVECLAVGQQHEGDERVILFLRLKDGVRLSPSLEESVRKAIKNNASPFHVPKFIFQVTDLPRTRNGKLVELAVKDLLAGKEIKNLESIANPEALEEILRAVEKSQKAEKQ